MGNNKYEEMLNGWGVRPTANRILILKSLYESARPLSMVEIESMVKTVDKSNISRTLGLFRDNHLVHIIEAGDSLRYELCHSHNHKEHDDMHVHFYCERCHRTFCINSPIPQVQLPEGYSMRSVNYMVKGICRDCRKHK